jgi:hypothetical protein
MECPCQYEVIVYTQFIQSVCEVALVDQPAGFVDYYQCVDDPFSVSYVSSASNCRTYIVRSLLCSSLVCGTVKLL